MNLNKDTSYLLGVYMGDGSIWDNGNGTMVFGLMAIDKDFVEATSSSIGNVTGKSPNIFLSYKPNRKSPYYRCSTTDKDLIRFLVENTHSKTIIPKVILEADNFLFKEFMAGLLDSEGYVAISKRHMYGGHPVFDMRIGFAVCDTWIYELREELVRRGIKCTIVRRYDAPNTISKTQYRMGFNKQSFIENGLYFKIQRKQQRIEYYKSLFSPSTTRRGIPFTDEHKKKISESLKGREFTEAHREAISKARKKWIETHEDIRRDELGRFVKR